MEDKSKRSLLIESEFEIIETSSKLAENVKQILYDEDIELRRKQIACAKENMQELVKNIEKMCDALRIDVNEVIGRI